MSRRPVNVFQGSTGLNTVLDGVRIPYDRETGMTDLAAAVNVTIDKSGRISMRKGRSLKQAGSFHSLFRDRGDCFVVKERDEDAAIYQMAGDCSLTGVRSGLSRERRMSFCQVNRDTWYANGRENGVIRDGVSNPWPEYLEPVGPETTRQLFAAPVGDHLAHGFSRMFIARDKLLVWSQPFNYGAYRLASDYLELDSRIVMVKPVAEGLFVSDELTTWFYRGTDPKKFIPKPVALYPALEWSCAHGYVDGLEIGLMEPGLCAVWASPEGACLGTASGQLINLNKRKVVYPENVSRGAGLIMGYNFVHCME